MSRSAARIEVRTEQIGAALVAIEVQSHKLAGRASPGRQALCSICMKADENSSQDCLTWVSEATLMLARGTMGHGES
eukprot:1160021-Pelagomonas_calceolata.AAC.7